MGEDVPSEGLYSSLEADLRIKTISQPELGELVNFGINESVPVHRWYYFKEGYSNRLVERMLDEFKVAKGSSVLDPFAGSGTTLLTCQWRGIYTIGLDINPFFSFVEKVKLNWFKYDSARIEREMKKLSELSLRRKTSIDPPGLSSFERGYSPSALKELLLCKEAMTEVDDDLTRDFLLLGLASILEDTSLMKKDGKGLKFVEGRQPPPVRKALIGKLREMLDDIRLLRGDLWSFYRVDKVEGKTFTLDSRNMDLNTIGQGEPVDFVMFSPPYLNTFDYTEVYKLELWFLDFVKNYDEFKKLRASTLRSHNLWPWEPTKIWQNDVLERIVSEVVKKKLWSDIIPVMIQGYFDDMYLGMKNLHGMLKPDGYCLIVVGNSAYGGIPVPTDLLLAKIAEDAGFKPLEIKVARSLLTSSQQLKGLSPQLRSVLRESIVVLKNS